MKKKELKDKLNKSADSVSKKAIEAIIDYIDSNGMQRILKNNAKDVAEKLMRDVFSDLLKMREENQEYLNQSEKLSNDFVLQVLKEIALSVKIKSVRKEHIERLQENVISKAIYAISNEDIDEDLLAEYKNIINDNLKTALKEQPLTKAATNRIVEAIATNSFQCDEFGNTVRRLIEPIVETFFTELPNVENTIINSIQREIQYKIEEYTDTIFDSYSKAIKEAIDRKVSSAVYNFDKMNEDDTLIEDLFSFSAREKYEEKKQKSKQEKLEQEQLSFRKILTSSGVNRKFS